MARQNRSRYMVVATGALAVTLAGGCSALESSASASTPSPEHQPSSSESGPPDSTRPTGETAESGQQPCRTADLSVTLGNPRKEPTDAQGQLGAAGTHEAVDLMWTNHSSQHCTMNGFAGVDLRGPDPDTGDNLTYSLPRAGTPHTVTLAPDATAHAVIRYINPQANEAAGVPNPLWTPQHAVVTPPGETNHLTVSWPADTPVDNQDKQSGTSAASISPVLSGS